MISIITAIHNQLVINKLFFYALKKYTCHPFELIVIDNNSNDGSREFFEQNGAVVIHNNENYSYPRCQNQGIRQASYNILAFLNNDIIVSAGWDIHVLNVVGKGNYDVVSLASNDRGIDRKESKTKGLRWKRIRYPFFALLGVNRFSLRLSFKLMYGNWEKFTGKIFAEYGYQMSEGFSGSAIIMTTQGIDKVGLWDERIQTADYDIYARCKQRHEDVGDIQPLSIISGVYIHHYGRMTLKSKRKPVLFADINNITPFKEKWGVERWEHVIQVLTQ